MIIILKGGTSAEREVSLKTGASIAGALDTLKREYKVIDAADSDWLDTVKSLSPEAVLIALHGTYGEDGTVQQLLEENHIPFSGSNSEASAKAMNKEYTKEVARSLGVQLAEGVVLKKGMLPSCGGLYPVVVKPNDNGSSFGVTIVKNESELLSACTTAFELSDTLLIETYIKGVEYSCGVIEEEGEVRALPLVEIRPKTEFFDYEAKYTASACDEICPAELHEAIASKIQAQTIGVFKALGCSHYSRADWIVAEDQTPYFLEINTLPGMTVTSLLPKELQAAGIAYEDFIENLIELAKTRR